jgi:hypothetical protein
MQLYDIAVGDEMIRPYLQHSGLHGRLRYLVLLASDLLAESIARNTGVAHVIHGNGPISLYSG